MNLSSILSIFKKKSKQLTVPDSILVKKLKNLSTQSNLHVYTDVTIYHHTDAYHIGLMLVDTTRGLYLFERKEWTYDELKNADIQKAQKQETSDNTLSFENTHNIIRQKFNELTHSDGVPIFNFLLMENLNTDEYQHLNDSFKELLPEDKVIFSDSSEADIFKKLQAVSPENKALTSFDEVLGTLFIQYTFLDKKNRLHLGSDEQIAFIDAPLPSFSELTGISGSGKSELLLLKAITELLTQNAKKIIIIKPTILSCDLLKKKFLEMIEHAIVEINLDALEIITPLALKNKQQQKVDLIICDDAHLLEDDFITYLTNLQKNRHLLLVTNTTVKEQALLSKKYRGTNTIYRFHQTLAYAKALQIIERLLRNNSKNIVLLAEEQTRLNLQEDLVSFIKKTPQNIQSDKHLLSQISSDILFCDYEDINAIEVDHIILMDLSSLSENLLEYAINLPNHSADILYEEESPGIQNLRNRYEQSSKE